MTPIVLPKSGFTSEASTVIGWSVAEGGPRRGRATPV